MNTKNLVQVKFLDFLRCFMKTEFAIVILATVTLRTPVLFGDFSSRLIESPGQFSGAFDLISTYLYNNLKLFTLFLRLLKIVKISYLF